MIEGSSLGQDLGLVILKVKVVDVDSKGYVFASQHSC